MAKKKKADRKTDNPPIEASMEELQQIVDSLEGGQDPLEASLQKFERGMRLLRSCHQQLEAAAAKIEILTGFDSEGDAVTDAFDGSATHSSSSPGPAAAADAAEDEESSTLF